MYKSFLVFLWIIGCKEKEGVSKLQFAFYRNTIVLTRPLFFLLRLLRFVIVYRTPPDQIPSAARSDCVRRPIGLRSPSDWISSACRRRKF